MTFQIRPFTDADYEAVAELASVIFESPVTADALRLDVQNMDPKCKLGRWVAEVDGKLVAAGGYGQWGGMYHPQKFEVNLHVHPDYRRRGIGSALYETTLKALEPFNPIALGCNAREDWPDSLRFAATRGFVEKMRNWENHLDVQEAAVRVYAAMTQHVTAQGYVMKSMAELQADPEWEHRLYDLVQIVRRDVPSPGPMTEIPFEQWVKNLRTPYFWPEGYFVAIKDGEWVALSALWKSDDADVRNVGLTAVKREHRGTGIAKALKVQTILAAKAAGVKKIKTWNESNNQKMLAINEKLGFVRKPAWIYHTKEL